MNMKPNWHRFHTNSDSCNFVEAKNRLNEIKLKI